MIRVSAGPGNTLAVFMIGLSLVSAGLLAVVPPPADLIFAHGKVWTVDPAQPVAQAVAVTGDRIVAVGSDREVLAWQGPATSVIDLQGRMLLPGFNDAHTHFENAVDWFFQVQVMDVNSQSELLRRLQAAVARVPKGMWITGGDWGSFAWWAAQKRGYRVFSPFTPNLAAVDAVSPDHPVLLRRFDHTYFVNSRALRVAGIAEDTPDPRGGHYDRDPATGRLTGLLLGSAGEQVEKLLPPPSRAQKLIGARGVASELNQVGITSIHDIAHLDDISQTQVPDVYLERSYSDVGIFTDLEKRRQLTVRVHAFMPLVTWDRLAAHGIRPRSGSDFVNYGTLKDFVDGSLMFAPFLGNGSYTGSFTFRFKDERTTQSQIDAADRAGFDVGFHVIGDRGLHVLLDRYEKTIAANGPRPDRRFRIIHVWYATAADLARAGRMRMIADVTPHQLLGADVGGLEAKLGPERAKTAFAWRTMIDAGVRIDLVSDLPGLFNHTEVAPYSPLENIYSAVTRMNTHREPAGGWHPEQAMTLPEAIQAYTLNPAFASHEENRKGTVTVGKLADLVVVSRDLFAGPPEDLLATQVDCTVVGGKIVYRRR